MKAVYTLMRGAGNRIAIVDERRLGREPPSTVAIAGLAASGPLAGFDQLMWLTPARDDRAVLAYRVFNADGSEVEQCGNGIRCVARLWSDGQGGRTGGMFEGPTGPVEARIAAPDRVAVNMGRPRFEPGELPFLADSAADTYELLVNGERIRAAALSMGNPHCVIEVSDVAAAALESLGPAIECHERFPARTNVGFMAVCERDKIDLRVWERGVGETLACGTGACAAVVAARRLKKVGDDVCVNLPGGQLMVSWRGAAADPVWLSGNAERISEGSMEI